MEIPPEIPLEEAARLRDREEPDGAATATEAIRGRRGDSNGVHDLREEFEGRDVPRVLAVRVEDKRESVGQPDAV